MTADIVTLGGLDENDEAFQEFIEGLRDDNVRAVFIVEKTDGSVMVGTNSTDRRDIVYDVFRLQQLCEMLVKDAE